MSGVSKELGRKFKSVVPSRSSEYNCIDVHECIFLKILKVESYHQRDQYAYITDIKKGHCAGAKYHHSYKGGSNKVF